MEKGVSSYSREPFFNMKKRLLYLQTMVFTPLSIRRGAGGEAVVGLCVRLLLTLLVQHIYRQSA